MRVTVICSDVSENVLSRAQFLTQVLSRDFDVDLIGTRFGRGIWAGARDQPFHRIVDGRRWPMYASSMRQLAESIRGDVVYAVKPLVSSLGIALAHRDRTGIPVIADADDDELAFRPPGSWSHPLRRLSILTHPLGHDSTAKIVARVKEADAVTVASTGLQAKFGGTIVPHAKDTDAVRPGITDRHATRRALGLDADRVVMFMGTPRSFKGVEDAAMAVRQMRNRARFVVVGADPSSAYARSLAARFPEVVLLPPYQLEELAKFLDVADAVVVPSHLVPQTRHQQPGKLLDAMAMAKPIVATAVADMPDILADGRGLIVPPADVTALAAALDAIFDDASAAGVMGARAREWCVANASHNAMQPVLRALVQQVAERTLTRPVGNV